MYMTTVWKLPVDLTWVAQSEWMQLKTMTNKKVQFQLFHCGKMTTLLHMLTVFCQLLTFQLNFEFSKRSHCMLLIYFCLLAIEARHFLVQSWLFLSACYRSNQLHIYLNSQKQNELFFIDLISYTWAILSLNITDTRHNQWRSLLLPLWEYNCYNKSQIE